MARKINRLNARAVATLTKYGRHADGGGLYLSLSANGGRRWVFLYRWHGKHTEIGLGSARDVPLARARELAGQARAKLTEGINPKDARKPTVSATFGECADRLIEAMRPSWRSSKHAQQWEMTLREYAAPLRRMSVDAITTDDVLTVLKPLWHTRPETASRVRARIERVLEAAKAQGLRKGDNPARWRGHLNQLLAKRQKVDRPHHAALPYAEVPAFLAAVRKHKGAAARCLEFIILTAARTGEAVAARMDEIADGVWSIPGDRMKAGRAHRVPLSARALEIIDELAPLRNGGDSVFPGQDGDLSDNAPRELATRIRKDLTVHGFRSSFRDWAAEANFSRELCEAALAHVDGSVVERAYRRTDLFEQRRALMRAWENHCLNIPSEKVIPLRA
jgi:integrase